MRLGLGLGINGVGSINSGDPFTLSASGLSIDVTINDAVLYSPANTDYDVILLAGQSNMIGRNGSIDEVLDAPDERIFQYGWNGHKVVLANDPLDHDGETANTIGMGMTFAKQYLADNPTRKILLVPTAKGATGFQDTYWQDGGTGYNGAITQVEAAIAAGDSGTNLVAILWHQGEDDNGDYTEAQYAAQLDALISGWRSDIDGATSSTPFIAGDIADWSTGYDADISAAIEDTPNRVPYTAFVETDDLSDGGDSLHFSAAAQRTLGERYYTALASALINGGTLDAETLSITVTANAATLSATTAVELEAEALAVTVTVNDVTTDISTPATLSAETLGITITANDATLTMDSALSAGTLAVSVTANAATIIRSYVLGAGVASFTVTANDATLSAGAATGPSISTESGALGHWVFGTDNTSFLDSISGSALTPVTSTPTNSSGYLTLATEQLNGLQSEFGADETTFTICAVVRMPNTSNRFLFGNLGPDDGGSMFVGSNIIKSNIRDQSTVNVLNPVPTNQWVFMAISFSSNTSRVDYIGDASSPIINTSGANNNLAQASVDFGIGDVQYDNASYTAGCDYAEFIIFDTAKNSAALTSIYDRTVTRLAARGITVE